jgi:UDPglucose 6-dehydrogenase
MKICVVGTGYVGLVAGTCFAESGNDVICVDIDEAKIRMLEEGKVPIFEPGLKELILRNVREGRLSFTTGLDASVKSSRVVFIAVGTPPGRAGRADLSAFFNVAKSVARSMNGYKVLVDKSTVPVGTAEKVRQIVAKTTRHPFDVVSNPEFMKEGAAVEDFLKPDRVVIGADSDKAVKIMKELYAPFVRTEKPILVMDPKSAEMTKYASNSMLATKISFINEISNLCEATGADVDAVRRGIGFDSRIGFKFLFPGTGYGGSCFPKDVNALIHTGRDRGCGVRILEAVEAVNREQKKILYAKVNRHFKGRLRGRTFAIWGLAFKPQTDDMREAPSIEVIKLLLKAGARIRVHDPEAMVEARRIFGGSIEYFDVSYDALDRADALVLMTEWNEFRQPDFARIKKLLRNPIIFDGRNIFDPRSMRSMGFTYYSIGRP